MRFRWTIKDLKEKTDNEILLGLVVERQSDCTNVYTPLYQKLSELYARLDEKVNQERLEIAPPNKKQKE